MMMITGQKSMDSLLLPTLPTPVVAPHPCTTNPPKKKPLCLVLDESESPNTISQMRLVSGPSETTGWLTDSDLND